jgi:hypothetical protein
MGHSRAGQVAFNFTYFKAFLDLAQFKGDPFACNISINSGSWWKPPSPETTGRPALVFLGEHDDVWHQDVIVRWLDELTAAGNPIERHTLKGSYHDLSNWPIWCPRVQTGRNCREQIVYTAQGPVLKGVTTTRAEVFKTCGTYGYTCGYGKMELYPEMLDVATSFMTRVLPKP